MNQMYAIDSAHFDQHGGVRNPKRGTDEYGAKAKFEAEKRQ